MPWLEESKISLTALRYRIKMILFNVASGSSSVTVCLVRGKNINVLLAMATPPNYPLFAGKIIVSLHITETGVIQ